MPVQVANGALAEAKITIRRHEVVYRLSSEHKMIDLE